MKDKILKMIIVDDEPLARDMVKYCLDWEKFGIVISGEADSADEAMRLMDLEPADIVITDIEMPEVNGLALSERLKARYPETEIIIVTGYDEFEYARKSIKLGIADFLLKPIDDVELKKIVEKIKEKICERGKKEAELDRIKWQVEETFPFLWEQFIGGGDEKQEGGEKELFALMKLYIKEHYYEHALSLSVIAEEFHLNASYLSRIFKKGMGKNFSEYLLEIRMRKALQLLQEKDYLAYELSELVGFSDPDYFGRCFKKFTGVSFSEYKK